MRPPSRTTWFLWPLLFLPLAAVTLFLIYPKAFTGDYAEIRIDSVTVTGEGAVEIRYSGRISVGTQVYEVSRRGDREYKTHRRGSSDRFPGRPEPVVRSSPHPEIIRVYSIMNERGLPGDPVETRARILVQSGRTYQARPGKPLHLYRYTTSDGVLTERYLEVLPQGR